MPSNDEDVVQGNDIPVVYVDAFRFGYDAYKFVFDFGSSPPAEEKPRFTKSVVTTPDHAKAFFEMLAQSIREYENKFSRINKTAR